MNDQFRELLTKKNLISLLSLAIIALAIPIGIDLARKQQTIKSRAAGATLSFVAPNVEGRTAPNGNILKVATAGQVGIQILPPEGWVYGGVATPTPSGSPTATIELKRYNNTNLKDHWTTSSLQSPPPGSTYQFEISQGMIFESDDGSGNLQPIYDCVGGNTPPKDDHYIYPNNGCDALTPTSKVLLGYIYKTQQTDTTALYHCFDSTNNDGLVLRGQTCAQASLTDRGLIGYSVGQLSTPTPTPTATPTATPSPTPPAGVPTVDLKIVKSDGSEVNLLTTDNRINQTFKLKWTTTGNPTSCTPRTLNNGARDTTWDAKQITLPDGEFTTKRLSSYGYWLYTIECENAQGDAIGDTVTINQRATVDIRGNDPRFNSFQIRVGTGGNYRDGETPVTARAGQKVYFTWNTTLTGDLAECISFGSWRQSNVRPDGSFVTPDIPNSDKGKELHFTVYCSNDKDFAKKTATINVEP